MACSVASHVGFLDKPDYVGRELTPKLLEDVLHVRLHRALREREPLGDDLVGEPPADLDLAIVIGMAVIALAIVVGAFMTTYAGHELPDVVWTIPAGVVGAFGGALGMRNRGNGQ